MSFISKHPSHFNTKLTQNTCSKTSYIA